MKIRKTKIPQYFSAIEITNIKPESKKINEMHKFAKHEKIKIQDGLNPQHQPSFYLMTQEEKQEPNLLKCLKAIFQNSEARIGICSLQEAKQASTRLLDELA